ncbi:1,2-phenylacetyl-CoA epoxidase subunit PaaE [Croceimicrobium sp.]|uniref:1,2-phenylacetyl-CoA epoxidase subunit PaaE n=1 Tax=Croceimicrobium sp. TaxID=2828340 RepID=UPI003BACA674
MLNFFKKVKKAPSSLFSNEKKHSRPTLHDLTVLDICRETPDCVSVAFEVPAELSEAYHFKPGQYLTLEAQIDGEAVRRSYSLCSSPFDGELRVAIKEVEGGKFSTWANQKLTVGTPMRVMTPEGNFTANIDPREKHNYVGFAAGSGITPVYSILKSVLENEPESTFTLFYGNKSAKSVIFKEQIEALKNQYMNRLEVHHVLSREDQGTDYLKGRIDALKCKVFAERFFDISEVDGYFLCGPEAMINGVSEELQSLGADKSRIHYELFNTPAQSLAGKTKVSSQQNGAKLDSKITVILDGDETHFDLNSDGDCILDAALDAGADVPYACKGAVCCTCRAKVIEGEVEMEMNYALEDDEVEDGYVLTCQSHPRTEKVVVSFDD